MSIEKIVQELNEEFPNLKTVEIVEGKTWIDIGVVHLGKWVDPKHFATQKQIDCITNNLWNVYVYKRVHLDKISKESAFVIIHTAMENPKVQINVKKIVV